MKPLKLYTFINNGKMNNVISPNFEAAVEENKKALTANNLSNIIALAGVTDFNKLVACVDSFFGNWRDGQEPRPFQADDTAAAAGREKNKQETLNFLKVIRDKYGKKSIGAIIKDLEYGG